MYTDSQKEVNKDITDSAKAFDKIKDTIIPLLISGKIIPIESQENDLKKLLDLEAGIDYFRKDKHGLQGIAWRAQFGFTCNTFTIRTERESGNKTELEKRLYAIENDYIYPEFTIQAYFDNKINLNLYSIAIIKTVDLFNFYKDHNTLFGNGRSNADFIFIWWGHLKDLQIKVYEEFKKDNYYEVPF